MHVEGVEIFEQITLRDAGGEPAAVIEHRDVQQPAGYLDGDEDLGRGRGGVLDRVREAVQHNLPEPRTIGDNLRPAGVRLLL